MHLARCLTVIKVIILIIVAVKSLIATDIICIYPFAVHPTGFGN
jgi:hypothetical protein